MTRLFGCICNQPERLNAALEPARERLIANAPIARWGLGYIHSGQVLLRLHPRTAETDVDFFEATDGIRSDYVIGATCNSDGLGGNENTPPFRFRRWMFAMEDANDAATEWSEFNEAISEQIPGYLRRNMSGKTASEHIFHLLLAMLSDGAKMDHPNLEMVEARDALRGTLAAVYSQLTRLGASVTPGNLIVTNGRFMLAARLGGPLHIRQFREQLDDKRPESQFKSVLIVSGASGLDDESSSDANGFEIVPEGQLVQISREVLAERVPLS